MKPLIVILGPTASGKTQLAVHVARKVDGEILSADSRQVYRKMDIGTGKDLSEYDDGGTPVSYHLIDIADAGEKLNINDYHRMFTEALQDVLARGKQPILCGGSGLYLETAIYGNELAAVPVNKVLREELRNEDRDSLLSRYNTLPETIQSKTDSSTSKRIIRALEIAEYVADYGWPASRNLDIPLHVFGTNPPVDVRRQRISKRLEQRLQEGLIEEVERLLNTGVSPASLHYYGLEYKWVTMYLNGIVSLEEMQKKLETDIHRFAKRQMTWFRRMERNGLKINWLREPDVEEVMELLGKS